MESWIPKFPLYFILLLPSLPFHHRQENYFLQKKMKSERLQIWNTRKNREWVKHEAEQWDSALCPALLP